LIWSRGLSHSESRSSKVGIFYYGKIGLAGSSSRTEGSRQTKLSELNDPPIHWGISGWVGAFILCMIFIPIVFSFLRIHINGEWLLIATVLYMIIQDIFYYPDRKDEWDKSFFCSRCGAQYIPEGKVLKKHLGS